MALILISAAGGASPGGTGSALAQENLVQVQKLADARVAELPAGGLRWRVERFPSRAEAEAAAGPAGLVGEMGGSGYLVTLLGDSAPPARGSVVAEISGLERPVAPEYLLQLSLLTGAPGSQSAIHNHPGIESYYVGAGELTVRSDAGTMTLRPGQSAPGVPPDRAVQALNTGSEGLQVLVLFAVDATRPLTSPATLPTAGPALSGPLIGIIAGLVIVGMVIGVVANNRRGRGAAAWMR